MPYYVYVLQSESTGRHYCGQTNNLKRRIAQHNNPNHQVTRTTKVFQGPWKLLWSKELISRSDVMKLERKIKKRGIKRFLEDLEGC